MPEIIPDPAAILSVSDLNRQVRQALENIFPLAWVRGEISNLTYAASGHVYFALKDAGAQVRCVLWRNRAQLLGWRLENGQQIEARVLVSFYEPRGEFQLNVESVRRAGQGDLYLRFLERKAKLEAEGLFAPERKRALPKFPRRIAIVTSPQAAALRDVLTTFRRRAPHVTLTLYPAPVQGEGAAARIATALRQADRDAHDLILLCRGGGSIEDLWAFNEEAVARAIVSLKTPVIAGIGHETDFTIADFAADLRAPTPTAGAELASLDRSDWLERLDANAQRLARAAAGQLNRAGQSLDHLQARLLHPAQQLRRQNEALDRMAQRLALATSRRGEQRAHRLNLAARGLLAARPQTAVVTQQLDTLATRLAQAMQNRSRNQHRQLEHLASSLRQLDPHAVLGRGYALARSADGSLIRDTRQLSPGAELQLQFGHGQALANVTQVVSPPEAD